MTPTGPDRAPAGWYADPSGNFTWRWWDGSTWTSHVWPVGPGAAGLYAAERTAAPYAKAAFVLWLLGIVAGLLVSHATGHQVRAEFDSLRAQLHGHLPANPRLQQPPLWGYVATLPQILALVGLLIWQLRAARTARALRLPAKRSPELGAVSWIIPVINYWFPYQALRDCLPPGAPGRAAVARMWALFIAMSVTVVAASPLLILGVAAGTVLGVLTLVLGVGFAVTGTRSIEAISQSHDQLISGRRP